MQRRSRGFQRRLATEDLAVAMNFNHSQKVATAHAITDLLTADGVDTRDDLHAWLGHKPIAPFYALRRGWDQRASITSATLLSHSQVAVDVHLRTFAADAGVPDLRYEQLRAVYEEAAAILGHDQGGLEHAVWRYRSGAV